MARGKGKPFKKGRRKTGGRKKGTPNRVSGDLRLVFEQILRSEKGIERMQKQFDAGKLPARLVEMFAAYVLGKPAQHVELGGKVSWIDALKQLDDE